MTEKGSETEGREVKGFQQEVLRKNELSWTEKGSGGGNGGMAFTSRRHLA